MANKKTTTSVEKIDTVTSYEPTDVAAPVHDVVDVAPVIADGADFKKVDLVRSKIWNTVENSADIATFAMNLPSGVMIAVFANDVASMQYVAGIHYDVTAKRFSV